MSREIHIFALQISLLCFFRNLFTYPWRPSPRGSFLSSPGLPDLAPTATPPPGVHIKLPTTLQIWHKCRTPGGRYVRRFSLEKLLLISVFDLGRPPRRYSSLEDFCRHPRSWGNSIPTLVQEWRNFATSGDLQGGEEDLSLCLLSGSPRISREEDNTAPPGLAKPTRK